MEWKDLTIQQAQYTYSLIKGVTDEHSSFEAKIKALSYLTNTPEETINSWDLEKFNNEIDQISFMYNTFPDWSPIRRFKVNGRSYKVNYNVEKVSYVPLYRILRKDDDIIFNLHKLMALIVKPVNIFRSRKYEKISEEMKQAPFIICFSAAVFFSQLYTKTLKRIQPFLEKELSDAGMEQDQSKETVSSLLDIMEENDPTIFFNKVNISK